MKKKISLYTVYEVEQENETGIGDKSEIKYKATTFETINEKNTLEKILSSHKEKVAELERKLIA